MANPLKQASSAHTQGHEEVSFLLQKHKYPEIKIHLQPKKAIHNFGFAKRLGRTGQLKENNTHSSTNHEDIFKNIGKTNYNSTSMPDLISTRENNNTTTRDVLPAHLTKTFCRSLAYVAPEMLNTGCFFLKISYFG